MDTFSLDKLQSLASGITPVTDAEVHRRAEEVRAAEKQRVHGKGGVLPEISKKGSAKGTGLQVRSNNNTEIVPKDNDMNTVFKGMVSHIDSIGATEQVGDMAELANINDDVDMEYVKDLLSHFENIADSTEGKVEMQKLSDALGAASEQQRMIWINEIQQVISEQSALSERSDNPFIVFMYTMGNVILKDTRIDGLDGVSIPQDMNGNMKGGLAVFGAAGAAVLVTYLSWAVTRSGASDIIEPYTPMLRELLAKVVSGISDVPLATLTNIEGGVLSAGIATTIFFLRGKRFRSLSKSKKALFMAAVLASGGLGVYSVQKSLEDGDKVAHVGTNMKKELGPMGVQIKQVDGIVKVLTKPKQVDGVLQPAILEKIVQDKIDAEVNNPGKPGFGNDSLTISMVLNDPRQIGAYRGKHDAYMSGEGRKKGAMSEKKRLKYTHAREGRITKVQKVQKEHGVHEGVNQWVARLTKTLSADRAVREYDTALETAKRVSGQGEWEHVFDSFSPSGKVTPEGMRQMRAGAIKEFIGVVNRYENFRNVELKKMFAYLKDMKTQTGVDMTGVVRDIAKRFPKLPMSTDQLNTMLAPPPSITGEEINGKHQQLTPEQLGIYKILPSFMIPSAETLESMKMTINEFYGFLALVTLIYGAFDLAIKPVQDSARNRRERLLRDMLTKDAKDINDAEEEMTVHITHFVQATLRTVEKMVAGNQKHGMTEIAPDDVVALTVRANLREWIYADSFAEEEISELNNSNTAPKRVVELQNKYHKALGSLVEKMKEDPINISASFAAEIYPSLKLITHAFRHGSLRAKDLESIYVSMQKEITNNHLGVFEQLLEEQEMSIEDIRRALRTEHGNDGEVVDTIVAEIPLDPNKESFTISRATSLQAFTLAQTNGAKNYLKARVDLLRNIAQAHNDSDDSASSQKGLLSRTAGVSSFVKSEPYMQMVPQDEAHSDRVENIDDEAEKTEAFNKFEKFMSQLNVALKPLTDAIEKDVDYFDGYATSISWRLDPEKNYYTIHIGLKDDALSVGQAAGIYYPYPVPNFKQVNAQEMAQEIIDWFNKKDAKGANNSNAYRGIVAQLQHFEYQKEREVLLKKINITSGNEYVSLVNKKGRSTLSDQDKAILIKTYRTQAILKDLTPDLLWLARSGALIEDRKYQRFIAPDKVNSAYGNVNIAGVLDSVIEQAEKHKVVLTYNPKTEEFSFIDELGRIYNTRLGQVTNTWIQDSLI